jgi:hypothetical protein
MENPESSRKPWTITAKGAPPDLETAVFDHIAARRTFDKVELTKPEAIIELLMKGVEAFRNEHAKKLGPVQEAIA